MRFGLKTGLVAGFLLSACSAEPQLRPMDKKDISALHSKTLTLDTHIDIPLTYMIEIDPIEETDLQVDLPKLKAGQLDSGFWIVYTPQGDLDPKAYENGYSCLLYTSPSPRDRTRSRMPSSA